MKQKHSLLPRLVALGALLSAALGVGVALPLHAQGADAVQLVPFALEDQFGQQWSEADFAGRVAVVMVADREGSEFSDAWAEALSEVFEGEIALQQVVLAGVAHLRGVPFFIKGMVRGSFSKSPEEWVLLDWGGHWAEHYPFATEHMNLMVFAPDGRQVFDATSRDVDQVLLDRMVETVRDVLPVVPDQEPVDPTGSRRLDPEFTTSTLNPGA